VSLAGILVSSSLHLEVDGDGLLWPDTCCACCALKAS